MADVDTKPLLDPTSELHNSYGKSVNSNTTPTKVSAGQYGALDDGREERDGEVVYSGCNPSKKSYRYVILAVTCLLTFGSYFSFDIPGSISKHVKDDLDLSSLNYNTLYSVYSWPNTVLVFYGGLLVDNIGDRKAAVIFTSICMIGQIIVSIGASYSMYPVMVFGRTFFGLGGESLAVAQNSITARWFRGKELALAFGFTLTVARLGDILAWNLEPYVYDWTGAGLQGLAWCFWLGSMLCVLSVFAAIIFVLLDVRGVSWMRAQGMDLKEKKKQPMDWRSVMAALDLRLYPARFWMLTSICVSFYAVIFPFTNVASDYLQDKYNLSSKQAGLYTSNVYNVSLILAPLTGSLVDHFGRRGWVMMFATGLTVPAYFLFAFTSVVPLLPLGMLGVAYSMCAAALWPSVPIVVETRLLGRALGLMQAFQNLGLAVVPLIVGALEDTYGYKTVMVFFMFMGAGSFLCAFILNYTDARSGGLMNAKDYMQHLFEALFHGEVVYVKPQQKSHQDLRASYLSKLGVATSPQAYAPAANKRTGPSPLASPI